MAYESASLWYRLARFMIFPRQQEIPPAEGYRNMSACRCINIWFSIFPKASSENACSVSPELFYSFVWLESIIKYTDVPHEYRAHVYVATMSPVSNAKRINWINGIWCIIIIASATRRRANYPGRKTRKEVGASGRRRREIREMRERRGWSARCNLKSSFVPMKLINRARRLLPPRTFLSPPHPFTTGLRSGRNQG